VCLNVPCKGVLLAKLVHLVKSLGIEEVGEPTIKRLAQTLGDYSPYSLLNVTKDVWVSIEGLSESTYETFAKQIEKLKKEGVSLARALYSLDLPQGVIGETILEKIIQAGTTKIEGVAETSENAYIEAIRQWNLLYKKDFPFPIIDKKVEVVGDKFKGEKLCFTGCRPSDEQKEMIISQGGQIVSGVSKNTTILVVKDLSDKTLSSDKAQKALQIGVKILEFKEV
jgi:NAD-dependent DNA ligase